MLLILIYCWYKFFLFSVCCFLLQLLLFAKIFLFPNNCCCCCALYYNILFFLFFFMRKSTTLLSFNLHSFFYCILEFLCYNTTTSYIMFFLLFLGFRFLFLINSSINLSSYSCYDSSLYSFYLFPSISTTRPFLYTYLDLNLFFSLYFI